MVSLPLTPITAPLTAEEVQAALDYLGLKLMRFHYTAPTKHRVQVTIQAFVRGTLTQAFPEMTFAQAAGEHTLTVYIYQQSEHVEFAIQSTHSRYGSRRVSLQGYATRSWYQFSHSSLTLGQWSPLFAFVANPDSIHGVGCTEEGCGLEEMALDTILTEYDLVVAGSAALNALD